jgi:hypothetical protein
MTLEEARTKAKAIFEENAEREEKNGREHVAKSECWLAANVHSGVCDEGQTIKTLMKGK